MDTYNTQPTNTMTNNQKTTAWVVGTIVLIIAAFFIARYFMSKSTITSFEQCVSAGYPVTKSFPEQCRTPDGKVFVNTAQTGTQAVGYVAGTVSLKAICQPGQSCTLPGDAYTSRKIVIYDLDGRTIKGSAYLDQNGVYKISIAPGSYLVALADNDGGQTNKKSVIVTSTMTSTVDFAIDVPLFVKG